MNWGVKIAVVFSLFVGGILSMVFKSSQQNIDLVTPHYYEQELKYQDVIEASQRSAALHGKLQCKMKEGSIELIFPEEMKNQQIKGVVWLYCISDKEKDVKNNFNSANGIYIMPVTVGNKGLHDIKVNWEAQGIKYYQEEKIFIQ